MNKTLMNINYRLIPWLITPYYYLFTIIFWQPFIWQLIKPKSGTIDNKAHWFHRHAVTCLNKCRGRDGWPLLTIGRLMIRDPHAHIENKYFHWSTSHLFVWSK